MPTAVVKPQERLRHVLSEAETIAARGVLDTEQATKMGELLTEGRALRAQIEQLEELDRQVAWGQGSAGSLPLTTRAGAGTRGAANVETVTPAGDTTIDRLPSGAMKILDQYGEGLFAPEMHKVISTPEYRDAFKSYIRGGSAALKSSELRVLQEGADTSGGLAV